MAHVEEHGLAGLEVIQLPGFIGSVCVAARETSGASASCCKMSFILAAKLTAIASLSVPL